MDRLNELFATLVSTEFQPLRVICMTPVKNEAWILPRFLAAASLWADDIIIADQMSTDGSAEIAARHPKVRFVQNCGVYHESYRQRLLLEVARSIPAPRLLVPLDADEFFSPDFFNPELIARLAAAGPGAYVRTRWFNVRSRLQDGWVGQPRFLAGWVDNGREVVEGVIHCERLPVMIEDLEVEGNPDNAIMHWQYTAPARLWSKHRWYQAWERLNRPSRHPVDIYRQYHHMNAIQPHKITQLPLSWLSWYAARGIDLSAISDDGFHWWNGEVLQWMLRYGAPKFAYEAIWDFDWEKEAVKQNISAPERFRDPRNHFQKLLHRWLAKTQPRCTYRAVRATDVMLRCLKLRPNE